MSARDPDTGQFVSGGDLDAFDRLEQQGWRLNLSVPAAELDGTTTEAYGEDVRIDGAAIYDAEEFLDRDEIGVLLWVDHRLITYGLSTASADSTVRAHMEISYSPERLAAARFGLTDTVADIDSSSGVATVNRSAATSGFNSQDLVGPTLLAVGGNGVTDGAAGVGAGLTAGWDNYEGPPWVEQVSDVRDTLFVNGAIEAQNASDHAAHADLRGWHIYGVMEI